MPGRQVVGDYRYGFNGQEKVDEISGAGNHNTAMFWEYDTRTGRRWNQDPRPNPSISNYATFGNNPIIYSDLLGDTVRYAGLKERIDVAVSKLSSKDFRREFNILKGSSNTYEYRRFEKGVLEKEGTFGRIQMMSADENSNYTFQIQYEKNDPHANDGYGRSPFHGLFEETFHAVDFDQDRSTSGFSNPDAQGRIFLGHIKEDQNHEARAWNFAANYAPFSPKIVRSKTEEGMKYNVSNPLIQQIKALKSNPYNPNPQISKWLYGNFVIDVYIPSTDDEYQVTKPGGY